MANKTASKFLAGIAGVAMLGAPALKASPLELMANETKAVQATQSSSPEFFFDLLKEHTFSVQELYSDGMVLSQSLGMYSLDYNLEILYLVKQGSDGKLTQWNVAVSAYSKSNPKKLVTRMRSYGNVEGGKFFVAGTELSGDLSTSPYSTVTRLFEDNVLVKVLQPSDKGQISDYVDYLSAKFSLLKAGHAGLKNVPKGYDPTSLYIVDTAR